MSEKPVVWTAQEMGRKGGLKTKARLGKAHYIAIGKKGGSRNSQIHSHEHFAAIGRKGGGRTAELVRKGRQKEGG